MPAMVTLTAAVTTWLCMCVALRVPVVIGTKAAKGYWFVGGLAAALCLLPASPLRSDV